MGCRKKNGLEGSSTRLTAEHNRCLNGDIARNALQLIPWEGYPEMPHYLLAGAGFSRNWGGWLANEAFEYLLGASEIDGHLRSLLWDAKLRGEGFEGALAVAQQAYLFEKGPKSQNALGRLTQAVIGMFESMQRGFNNIEQADPRSDISVQEFLSQFDAIFTLNQDTLLETIYAGNVRWSERWYGSLLPYMKFVREPEWTYPSMLRELLTEDLALIPDQNYQPIYKLHGSYNWLADPHGERLVVIGGNKSISIDKFAVLARYQSEFRLKLMEPKSFLMIIGYSFSDSHINSTIIDAIRNAGQEAPGVCRPARQLAEGDGATMNLHETPESLTQPSPDLLPIAIRAFASPREKANDNKSARKRWAKPAPASEWTLIFDTETTVNAAQRLRIGAYQFRKGDELDEAGLFYDPTIVSEEEVRLLRRFCGEGGHKLRTVTEFVNDVLYDRAYDLRASIVGFNLPFDISRLAVAHGSARGKTMRGGFTFKLSEKRWRPAIQIRHLNAPASLIQLRIRRSDATLGDNAIGKLRPVIVVAHSSI
jgi:SIR2-like domain